MSRSGYSDDCENLNLWRGTVLRAARGRRGQKFFRDLVAALDAMPERRLVDGALEVHPVDAGEGVKAGEVCALGALGRQRGVNLAALDTEDYAGLGATFDIARVLAQEVMFENDECGPTAWDHHGERHTETPEQRWGRVRKWAAAQILPTPLLSEGAGS